MSAPTLSLIVPIYRNSANIEPLLDALERLHREAEGNFEFVLVVDGSPDDSFLKLANQLPTRPFPSQLLNLSRNFGAFSAIRAGLAAGKGPLYAVLAADLQEPPELVLDFHRHLSSGEYDVAIGTRSSRQDPWLNRLASQTFWGLFRRLVMPEVPSGGADIFACNQAVRDQILLLQENNTSLIGQLFWVGYRRILIPYDRRQREVGTSAWTLAKKLNYLADSVFGFSDLPIRLLLQLGAFGMLLSLVIATRALYGKFFQTIPIPGYTTTIVLVAFFGGLNCFGIGIIGGYVWRCFENTKRRPNYIIASHQSINSSEGAVLE